MTRAYCGDLGRSPWFRLMPFGLRLYICHYSRLLSSLHSQITRRRCIRYCAPMRVHLHAHHHTSRHIAFASRHVTRPRVVWRGGNTARPTSRLPWRPGHPSSMLCSCPRHHAITSHHMHMCPAEPSHAPRLSGLRRLLRLLLRVPRLLRLHRCLELEDGWGPESSRNERTHARIRVRRNGGAVARGVIMRRTWLGILMPWT